MCDRTIVSGQLNWLNDQAMALVMREEQTREFVDQSCGDLKGSIDELEKWLKRIDQEGTKDSMFVLHDAFWLLFFVNSFLFWFIILNGIK